MGLLWRTDQLQPIQKPIAYGRDRKAGREPIALNRSTNRCLPWPLLLTHLSPDDQPSARGSPSERAVHFPADGVPEVISTRLQPGARRVDAVKRFQPFPGSAQRVS